MSDLTLFNSTKDRDLAAIKRHLFEPIDEFIANVAMDLELDTEQVTVDLDENCVGIDGAFYYLSVK